MREPGGVKSEKVTIRNTIGSSKKLIIGVVAEKTGIMSVGVYAVTGKQIARIAEQQVRAGTYAFQWACRDKNGNRVPPGAYLLRCAMD
jgi:flagellar hook assembly protein FlgD